SLGCVVYEMLGGDPPFSGSSANVVAARHRVDAVPPLRTIRPSVPPSLEAVVMRALEKIPADRYNTADQFAQALVHPPTPTTRVPAGPFRGHRRRSWLLLAGLLVVIAGTLYAIFGDHGETGPGSSTLALDTTHIAIIPAERDSLRSAGLDPALLLQDALSRWGGITVVDPIQVHDAMARRGAQRGEDWRRVARDVGAGRFIRVDAAPVGDSVRVHAVLYDTRGGTQLADPSVRVAANYAGSAAAYNDLAEHLLFRSAGPHVPMDSLIGTSSAPARQAFAKGQEALADWNLAAADSAFDGASRFDPQYAQALLWLAVVRSWRGLPVSQWSSAAERAASGRDRLSQREHQIGDAVLAQSREDNARACGIWKRLADQDTYSFAFWYGWGDCLRRDNVVIRSQNSPTGWRFRSSYHQALKAYQRAFQLLPSIHRAFRTESFASVRRLFEPSANDLRGGKALPPDTTTFLAPLSWEGDTLVLIPIPSSQVAEGQSTVTSTTRQAVRHQRELFHDVASGWVAAFPHSAEALENLALSLDVLGDRSALDTLRLARRLAREPVDKLRVAVAEVWMTLKFSILANPDGVLRAKLLADSLLRASNVETSLDPGLLSGLAVLTGRAHLAAQFRMAPAARLEWQVPSSLAGSAPVLMVYAAMGGPRDSLRTIEQRLLDDIDQRLNPPDRAETRAQWLAFPATLAFPSYPFESLESLAGTGDMLLDAQVAFMRGDSNAVIRTLREMQTERKGISSADLTIDALYLESWLWSSLGNPKDAADWLDPTLNALPETSSRLLTEVFRAGPLVRAMILRALLAQTLGDRDTARRWATAVTTLWSDADDFLQPEVAAMARLAK
ncbi:MAG: hypothetical protein ABI836_03220, partial [Gemmatimonadota bacterium]